MLSREKEIRDTIKSQGAIDLSSEESNEITLASIELSNYINTTKEEYDNKTFTTTHPRTKLPIYTAESSAT